MSERCSVMVWRNRNVRVASENCSIGTRDCSAKLLSARLGVRPVPTLVRGLRYRDVTALTLTSKPLPQPRTRNPNIIKPVSYRAANSCQRANRRSTIHIEISELLACGNLTRPARERYSAKPPCSTIRSVWYMLFTTKTTP